ncbi:MAG: phosphate acetyltransferase [Clostridia bacterium]
MNFLEGIFEKARNNKKTIVLPESGDIRTLKAAERLTRERIADIILIGNRETIMADAGSLDLASVEIIDIGEFPLLEEYTDALYEMRKEKGLSREQAGELMQNPLYFGVMLVKMGKAHGMVAGAVHSTAETLRPALQILRTAPGTRLVSGFFIMDHPDKSVGDNGLMAFGDCGVIEDPDSGQLADIAISTAKSFKALTEHEPYVAMLSYSTYGSAKSPLTEKVVEATRLAREKAGGIKVDGEMQVDAALVKAVGDKKAPGSPVAGKANVLIFPDLNAGNIAYKLVERLGGACAYGPLLQGIAKPVNDLSRGCSADDITGVVAITAVQAIDAEPVI